MSRLVDELRESFNDEEYRYGYVESFLDTYIAAQIRTLRESMPLSQPELAAVLNTKQSAISRLENVNYSAWSVRTLKRLARSFGVRLKISFEEFSTLPSDLTNFNKERLYKRPFHNDPIFGRPSAAISLVESQGLQPAKIDTKQNLTNAAIPPQGELGRLEQIAIGG